MPEKLEPTPTPEHRSPTATDLLSERSMRCLHMKYTQTFTPLAATPRTHTDHSETTLREFLSGPSRGRRALVLQSNAKQGATRQSEEIGRAHV